jgi:hypothetical protein
VDNSDRTSRRNVAAIDAMRDRKRDRELKYRPIEETDQPVHSNRLIVGGEVGARALLTNTSCREQLLSMAQRDGIE